MEARQASIEAALAPKAAGPQVRAIYLYDVTSVYFEGLENELADFGYKRVLGNWFDGFGFCSAM